MQVVVNNLVRNEGHFLMNPTEQLRLDLREGQCGLVGIGTVKGKTITQFLPNALSIPESMKLAYHIAAYDPQSMAYEFMDAGSGPA